MSDSGSVIVPYSSWGNVVGVFTRPKAVFESIRERPTVLVMMILLVVISAATTWFVMTRVDASGFVDMMQERIAEQGGAEMPREQLESMARVQVWVAPIGAAFGVVLMTVLGAGTLWLFMKLVGGDFTYRASLAVLAHALAPTLLASILTALVVAVRGQVTFDDLQSGSLLLSSPAALAPSDAAKGTKALLAAFDVFRLWSLVLATMGYAIVARVPRSRAAAVVVGLWALVVAGSVGVAQGFG